jgi:YesN/AraC family two-component response regulator
MLLFAWNLQPHTWETDIVRFRERLIKTSIQITRLGVDVIASVFFDSCNTDKNPCQVLQQIAAQYYRIGKGTRPETVQKSLYYILNNVEKKITLSEVADCAGVSPWYLSTLFKREFKQNLTDFINQTKIDRACELLREKKLRINDLSFLLGYENPFYFTKVFRRHTGHSPSEFIRNINE